MNQPNINNEENPLLNQQQEKNEQIGVEVEDEYLNQDEQIPPNQPEQKNIVETNNPIRQNTPQKKWQPYYQAKQSPSRSVRFFHSWYKFRDKLARPFNYKLPFFRRSAGMVILMILIFAAIVPFSYGKVFTSSNSDERVEVATFPPVLFLLLAFVFATRNSIPSFLFGISYENQLILHKFFSYMSVITGWFHGVDELTNPNRSINDWHIITGLILCIAMSILIVKGVLFKWMQTFFNTFLAMHWILFIIVLVFAVIHGAGLATIVGGGAFLIDLILRIYLIQKYKKLTKKCKIQKVANRVVEISFDKQGENFHYDPGQYAFLTIPDLSNFAMHPFSFQSCPYEQRVSFYIKNIGTYTERIRKLAEKKSEIDVKVHGPYGYPQIEMENNRFEYFVFFSGGIGVTAMQSYAKNLLYEHKMGRPLKRVIFCWTGREADFLEHIVNVRKFDKELYEEQQNDSILQMIAHVTTKNLDPNVLQKYRASVDHEIKQERIDIKDIIVKAQKEAATMGLKRIAVLSCGPHSMLQRVNFMASTLSGKDKVKVEYHRETFSFLTEIIQYNIYQFFINQNEFFYIQK